MHKKNSTKKSTKQRHNKHDDFFQNALKWPETAIDKSPWSGSMLGLLKTREQSAVLAYLNEFWPKYLPYFEQRGALGYIIDMLEYTYESTVLDPEIIHGIMRESLSEEWAERNISTADRLRYEGRQAGRQEGHQEEKRRIAKRMLAEGADIEFVTRVTGLAESEIKVAQADTSSWI